MLIKEYEDGDVKITVEERKDGSYITTYWWKADCYEPDRIVYVFETFGGAAFKAFDLLADLLEERGAKALRPVQSENGNSRAETHRNSID